MTRPLRLDAPTATSLPRRGALGTIGVAAQGAVRFTTSFLVGRMGGPAALGVVQSAFSTAILLSLLWPTTTGSAASKFIARARGAADPAQISAVARHLAHRTVQAGILLALTSMPIWVLIGGASWSGALCVAVLVLGLSGYSFTRGLQFGAGQVPRATAFDLSCGILGVVSLAVLLLVGVRGPVLLLPLAGSYLLYTAANWPWGARGKVACPLRRELDGFVALGVMGTVASTGFLQLSMIVARVVDGKAAAGQYAAALALATPSSLLAGSLSLVLFPTLSEAWGRRDLATFIRQTDLATRMLAVVMIGVFGVLVLNSRLAVHVVWGPRYSEATRLLPVLLFAVMTTTLGVACVNALSSRAQRGVIVASSASLVGLTVGAAVWALLAPTAGTLGVACGYLCGTTLIAGIPIVTVWRRDHQRWAGLAARVAGGVLLLVALLVAERLADTPLWSEPVVAAAFLAAWVCVMRDETSRVLAAARARGR